METLERDLKTAKTTKPVEKEVKKAPEPDADALKKLKARLQAVEDESKQKDMQRKLRPDWTKGIRNERGLLCLQ